VEKAEEKAIKRVNGAILDKQFVDKGRLEFFE